MVEVAPVRRGINAACNELLSRPVSTKMAGPGSPRVEYDIDMRVSPLHATAQLMLLLRAVLSLFFANLTARRG